MFKKILNTFFLIPAVFIIVALAVANRHVVRLVLDPLSPSNPMFALEAPFFVFLFGALLSGVLIGGLATWFTQRKWRRAVHQRSVEAHEWKREAERLKGEADNRQREALPSS